MIVELIKRSPVVTGFLILWLIFVIAVFMGSDDIKQERLEWAKSCKNIGGVPILDRHYNGIGNSLCLKPDSILEVPTQ